MDLAHVLLNPYFLGYVLIILVLIRCGNGMKRRHEENVKNRKAKSRDTPPN